MILVGRQIFTRSKIFQFFATVSGSISVISLGMNLAWTSPYLNQLQSSNSSIPTTPDEGSWAADMTLIGGPLGAITGALLIDKLGRKWTLMIASPILFLAYLTIAFAKTIWVIAGARFISGATDGLIYTVLPTYIGEISEPDVRGLMATVMATFGTIGFLMINIMGAYVSILTSSMIIGGLPILQMILFYYMPESPYYYIKKGNFVAARESLYFLRQTGDVQEEMEILTKAVERQESTKKGKVYDLFTVESNRKACFIFLILCLVNKFSGKTAIMFYTDMIFTKLESDIDPYISTIIYSSVELIFMIISSSFLDSFGKRPLFIISTAGCGSSLLILGLHAFMKEYASFYPPLNWIPLVLLICFIIFFSIGISFGIVTTLSELFPTNIKGVALCCADMTSVLMAALASKFFYTTNMAYGLYFPFLGFSLCCFVLLGFIIKYVPETKNKSLEEIQLFLMGEGETADFRRSLPNIMVFSSFRRKGTDIEDKKEQGITNTISHECANNDSVR